MLESLALILLLLLNNALWMVFYYSVKNGQLPHSPFKKEAKKEEPDFVELEDVPIEHLRKFMEEDEDEEVI